MLKYIIKKSNVSKDKSLNILNRKQRISAVETVPTTYRDVFGRAKKLKF